MNDDKRFRDWVEATSLRRNWRALGAFPLIADHSTFGALVLYHVTPHGWNDAEVRLLTFVAEHAAIAIRTAQLFDEQLRQVTALERVVRSLRKQSHEHANRLHTIAGLLAMNDPEEALVFVESVSSISLVDRESLGDLPQTALSALLAVESGLARQRSIAFEFDTGPGVGETAMTDAQAVTIIGNALDNAFEAVAEMPDEQRRVEVAIFRAGGWVEITVRDWGPGMPEWMSDPFPRGTSTKLGHSGVGLLLAREAAIAAFGDMRVEQLADGVRVVVRVPVISQVEPTRSGRFRAGNLSRAFHD